MLYGLCYVRGTLTVFCFWVEYVLQMFAVLDGLFALVGRFQQVCFSQNSGHITGRMVFSVNLWGVDFVPFFFGPKNK